MVLRWGETPADLDFYVIPKQTDSVGLWKTHGCWDENGNYCDENGSWNCDNLVSPQPVPQRHACARQRQVLTRAFFQDTVRPFMHKDERSCDAFTQPPALHWDVTGEGSCDCLPFNDPNCEATCFIETASSGAGCVRPFRSVALRSQATQDTKANVSAPGPGGRRSRLPLASRWRSRSRTRAPWRQRNDFLHGTFMILTRGFSVSAQVRLQAGVGPRRHRARAIREQRS